jgi:hypothetical protein
MLKNLEIIERKLEKESDTSKTGSHRTLERKKDRGVVVDIVVAPQSIPIRNHTVVQAHPL